MTTPATGRSLTTACNGVTTVFNCPLAMTSGDVAVYLLDTSTDTNGAGTLLAQDVDYIVSGDFRAGTGKITTLTAYPAGKWVRRWRTTSRAQVNDYVPNDGFPANSHETALDRLSLVDEEVTSDESAGIRVGAGGAVNAIAENAADRALKFMQFSADGANVVLLSIAELAAALLSTLIFLLGAGLKGDPGGNAAAIGLFNTAATHLGGIGFVIPAGYDVVRTSGYSTRGLGAADYVADAAVDAAYVAAHPRSSFISTNGIGFRLRHEGVFLQPEQTGALGNGAADDHAAFRALTLLGSELGHLHIELRDGGAVYRVGKQIANSVDVGGAGPFYQANENAIEALGLSSFIIRGNGATLKFNDGLKYGGFDPVTGLPADNVAALPSRNAHAGFLILPQGNNHVEIDGIIFDGNSQNITLGGLTDASHFEARHTGVKVDSFFRGRLTNCQFRYFLQDGWSSQQTNWGLLEDDPSRPFLAENCHSEQCGRCGIAILGGKDVAVINCSAIKPGAPVAGGGFRGTSPYVGMDIESESLIRGVTFVNCRFEQGANGLRAVTCDSVSDTNIRNISFRDCEFVGKVWAVKRNIRHDNCRFYGLLEKVGGNFDPPSDNSSFNKCFITDATKGDTPLQDSAGLLIGTASPAATGVTFNACHFDLSRAKANLTDCRTRDCTIVIRINTAYVAAASSVVNLNTSGDHDRLEIVDAIAASFPATPYFVSVSPATKIRRSNLTSATPYIRWEAAGATGFTGEHDTVTGRRGTDALTNANTALGVTRSKAVQQLDVPITADRDLTLPAATAGITRRYRVVRTANGTGAFNLNVKTSGGTLLKALGVSTWCDVESDNGAEYKLIGAGAL